LIPFARLDRCAPRSALRVTLADYLTVAASERFAWGGEIDCWLFGFDWVREQTGVDALHEFRGRYASAREQRRFIAAHGGTKAFTDRLLVPLGYRPIEDHPAPGDVALVWSGWKRFHGRIILLHVSGICVRPKLWAVKPTDGGILLGNFPVAHAWTLRYGNTIVGDPPVA
jgi:hypothetical protein